MNKRFARKRIFSLFLSALFLICVPSVATGAEAVLIRGNYWVSGITGFGANGFSALTGEYRLQTTPAARAGEEQSGNAGDFTVYATRDFLFFSGEWQAMEGTGNINVLQRPWEEGFLAALAVEDRRGTYWNAIFRFEQGLEGAGISRDDLNRLLRAWENRFPFFLSISRSPGEVSLPAAVEF